MSLLMAFSGSFLLSITFFELIPDVFETPTKSIGVYIMIGILLQIFLEFLSKGAEHGHVHIATKVSSFPWLLFFSLCVHSLLEGFPINEENNLLTGIIVHKIPITIILTFFFIKAKYSKTTILLFLLLFALMTPLGAWFSTNLEIVQEYKTQVTAIAIGVFLHVSTIILFESSKNHTFNLSKMTAVIIAVIIAYFL